ncbi:MAG: CBS domain-containing protein [Azospirillum sp.]|nr:CBS domain-containing protein [Azospirillum sp.]
MNVAEAMTKDVVTVPIDMPVKEIAALLTEKGIGGAPVVFPDGRTIGVVSESDLIARPETHTLTAKNWWQSVFTSRQVEAKAFVKSHGQTAGDVMTGEIVAIAPGATLAGAAALMLKKNVHRLLVLEAGRPIGVLTRSDLLRVLAREPVPARVERADGAILDEVEALMRDASWAPGRMVTAVVDGGVVYFHGFIENSDQRNALHVLAKGVPGVKRVVDDLAPMNLAYAYGAI